MKRCFKKLKNYYNLVNLEPTLHIAYLAHSKFLFVSHNNRRLWELESESGKKKCRIMHKNHYLPMIQNCDTMFLTLQFSFYFVCCSVRNIMKSEVIKSVFIDELERNKRLVSRYTAELASLPKGSVFLRKIGNQQYYYLNFRDGKKVISKFLGKENSFDLEGLQKQIARRKELQQILKRLKTEQKELEKELKK